MCLCLYLEAAQVAISSRTISLSSNQQPFLFNGQVISRDDTDQQLIINTVYQAAVSQSSLSMINMNYGYNAGVRILQNQYYEQDRETGYT